MADAHQQAWPQEKAPSLRSKLAHVIQGPQLRYQNPQGKGGAGGATVAPDCVPFVVGHVRPILTNMPRAANITFSVFAQFI